MYQSSTPNYLMFLEYY